MAKINTTKEAEEYFEHNPQAKELHFVMLDNDDVEALDLDMVSLYALTTHKNDKKEA